MQTIREWVIDSFYLRIRYQFLIAPKHPLDTMLSSMCFSLISVACSDCNDTSPTSRAGGYSVSALIRAAPKTPILNGSVIVILSMAFRASSLKTRASADQGLTGPNTMYPRSHRRVNHGWNKFLNHPIFRAQLYAWLPVQLEWHDGSCICAQPRSVDHTFQPKDLHE